MATAPSADPYPVRFDVDYPERLDRLSTFFRLVYLIPILILAAILSGGGGGSVSADGDSVGSPGLGVSGALFFATLLMLLFRGKYPRWWFDFARELTRFSARVGAYATLLRDEYPSTDEGQAVHLEIDYPDAAQLNRFLPLVKWFLAIPHYVVLFFLVIGLVVAVFVAWFAILFTGHYPRALFDYVVGVQRWGERVAGYMALLVTDRYPPFSLK